MVPPRTEALATLSLCLSIVGTLFLCCWIGAAGTIAGVITGVIARKKIAESDGMLTGDGLALAGIIVGAVGTVLVLGLFALSLVGNTTTLR